MTAHYKNQLIKKQTEQVYLHLSRQFHILPRVTNISSLACIFPYFFLCIYTNTNAVLAWVDVSL